MSNNTTEMKKELGMGAAMATVVGCVGCSCCEPGKTVYR